MLGGIKNLSAKVFILLLFCSCYSEKDKPEWRSEQCCIHGRENPSIVFTSTLTGFGDIYTVWPNGTNLLARTSSLTYKGSGRYNCGDLYTDSNSNGHYDPQEEWIDSDSNRCRDDGEGFTDSNGNGIWDASLAEPFWDVNNNGIYDCGEEYDDLNANGHYDPQEDFTDTNGNGCWDPGEAYTDSNGNGIWDASLAEPFIKYTGFPSTEKMPSCNNTGKEVIFVSNITGHYEIYKMNIDNGKLWQLTNDRDGHAHPVFSPDNSKIAYVFTVHDKTPPYTGRNQVFVMNADGTDKRQVTNSVNGVCCPSWSSDGSRIAYIENPYDEGIISIINSDGSGEIHTLPNVSYAKGPTGWANNDREILYWIDRDYWNNIPARIFLAPINGEYPPYQLSEPTSDNFNPNISRDGSSITYVSKRDGSNQIYIQDILGGDTRRITNITKVSNDYPAWCP